MQYVAGAGFAPSASVSFCHHHSIISPSPFLFYHKDNPAKRENLQTKKFCFEYRVSLKGKYFHTSFTVSRNLKYSAFFILFYHEGNCISVMMYVYLGVLLD
jgi:hypothetical protein